jgi:hypothetical protein
MSEYTGLSAASGDESSKFAALEVQMRHAWWKRLTQCRRKRW